MSIELFPSIAKVKRNGVFENLPGFVPETGSIATQQMIATSESSATAQYVHEKGEYFRLNDTLYQAIVKINVGDAIVVGTNCKVAVIGNDLSKVANSIANYELGIATSSHNTGDYFMVGETMYVATADIQVGNNISTSTNCRKAVVGDELSGLKTAISDIAVGAYEKISASGYNITLNNVVKDYGFKDIVLNIDSTSGVSSVTVVNYGKPLWSTLDTDTDNGYVNNKYLGNSGAEENSSYWDISEYIPVLPGHTYRFYHLAYSNTYHLAFYKADKTYYGQYGYNNANYHDVSLTPTSLTAFVRFSIRKDRSGEIWVEERQAYEIALGSTIQHGTLNLMTGELVDTDNNTTTIISVPKIKSYDGFNRLTVLSSVGSLDVTYYATNNDFTRKEIDAVAENDYQTIPFTLAGFGYVNATTGGIGTDTSIYAYTDYIDISKFAKIKYKRCGTTAESTYAGVAYYDANKNYLSGRRAATSQEGYGYLWQEANIITAKFMRASVYINTSTYGNFEIYGEYPATTKLKWLEANKLGLHTMPTSDGQLNVIKRARQLSEIKWTPVVDLPRHMLTGGQRWQSTFKAGVEYQGIPYGESSSTLCNRYNYEQLYVGPFVSLDTFVTAVSCKDSIIAKENVSSAANHQSIAYSCTCSGLVCYAINAANAYTSQIPNITGMSDLGKVDDSGTRISADTFRLGDILNVEHLHAGVITDIIRDKEGNVTEIEVTEETSTGEAIVGTEGGQVGGLVRRKGYFLEDFYSKWGKYQLLRYAYIENVPYTPSLYVNVGGELNMLKYDRLPCLPYEGDKFVYETGYIPNSAVRILIEASGYDKLRVFKDGTEIAASPISVDESDEYIDITEIGAGSYSAHLCTMTGDTEDTYTEPCYWTITA